MLQGNYEMSILVNGQPVKEYFHNDRMYVEGRTDAEYKIRIKNNGYRRIVVVPTVDGLSVIDGNPASYTSPGYIIPGYTTDTIDGWRSDDNTINKFYFSAGKDSYAKRNGQDSTNIGIIGAAVFEERENYKYVVQKSTWIDPWTLGYGVGTTYTLTSSGTTNSYSVSGASSSTSLSSTALNATPTISSNALGTGWGEEKKSSVNWIEFDRVEKPSAVFEIFYHTREELEKLGINLKDSEQNYVAGPQAFPRQYCQPPK